MASQVPRAAATVTAPTGAGTGSLAAMVALGEQVERILDRRPVPPGRGGVPGAAAGRRRPSRRARAAGRDAACAAAASGRRSPARWRRGSSGGSGVLAAPALVEHQAQRVDVDLGAGGASLGLLGRHVGEGADDVAGSGQGGGVGEAGDAEVHQLRARLAASVTSTFCGLMSRWTTERSCAWSSASQRSAPISPISRSLSVPSRLSPRQRPAVDQLGDEQGVAVLLAHLIERHDARVVEPRRGLGLAQDPLASPACRRTIRSP